MQAQGILELLGRANPGPGEGLADIADLQVAGGAGAVEVDVCGHRAGEGGAGHPVDDAAATGQDDVAAVRLGRLGGDHAFQVDDRATDRRLADGGHEHRIGPGFARQVCGDLALRPAGDIGHDEVDQIEIPAGAGRQADTEGLGSPVEHAALGGGHGGVGARHDRGAGEGHHPALGVDLGVGQHPQAGAGQGVAAVEGKAVVGRVQECGGVRRSDGEQQAAGVDAGATANDDAVLGYEPDVAADRAADLAFDHPLDPRLLEADDPVQDDPVARAEIVGNGFVRLNVEAVPRQHGPRGVQGDVGAAHRLGDHRVAAPGAHLRETAHRQCKRRRPRQSAQAAEHPAKRRAGEQPAPAIGGCGVQTGARLHLGLLPYHSRLAVSWISTRSPGRGPKPEVLSIGWA